MSMILLSNAVVSLAEEYKGKANKPMIVIGEEPKVPLFIGCLFREVIINIYDGRFFEKCFKACVFEKCTIYPYKGKLKTGNNLIII